VRAEVVNEDGRLDLLIFAKLRDPTGAKIVKKVWVLELKALVDRSSSGKTLGPSLTDDAIQKGLTQAVTYLESEHVNQAALCCFDMRATDLGDAAVFSHVQTEANDNKINLWRWFLHRSSDDARNAKRSTRLAAKSAEG
jgi:hypothetical protein